MSKPVATAIFKGPYGGEERAAIRKMSNDPFGHSRFSIKAPAYVAKAFWTVAAAQRFAEGAHNFIRWEA